MTRQSWVVRCSTILFARYGAYHGLLYPSRRGHVVSSSSSSNKFNKLVRQYYWCSPVSSPSSSSSSSSSQPNHAWSSGTVTSNRQELDIHDTTTISCIDEVEQNDSSTLHTSTKKVLPEFVHNVTAWFDHLNISYDLCQVPLSTMVLQVQHYSLRGPIDDISFNECCEYHRGEHPLTTHPIVVVTTFDTFPNVTRDFDPRRSDTIYDRSSTRGMVEHPRQRRDGPLQRINNGRDPTTNHPFARRYMEE